jgi:hypothetical protein
MERCKVLIADDNVRVRTGLRALLALRPEIELVGAGGFLRKGCPVDELLAAILGDRQRKYKDRMICKIEEVTK